MINFYPGPSKIHPEFLAVINEITSDGLSSYNHRSATFSNSYSFTQKALKNKLQIPDEYEIVFFSSATECWEVICRQFKESINTFLCTGSFSKKWNLIGSHLMNYTSSLEINTEDCLLERIYDIPEESDLIFYTDCETSNSFKFSLESQNIIRDQYPSSLIAVDATSSMGGSFINFKNHDITFASVQKCLGLPPGLAVLVLSPKAISAIKNTPKSFHYNDLNNVILNHEKQQTTHTPNTQLIISLGLLQNKLDSIKTMESKCKEHYDLLQKAIEINPLFRHYVDQTNQRSHNVLCIRCSDPGLVISKAEKEGFVIGKGYGVHKNDTFRIANFPSHTKQEIENLCNFISSCTM